MIKKYKNKYTLLATSLLAISYLLASTGIHGDDYLYIKKMQAMRFYDFIDPSFDNMGLMIFNFVSYYIFYWAYVFLGSEHQWIYDVIKVAVHSTSIYLVYRFALDYFPNDRALLASTIFIFYPLHDTIGYGYGTLPYILMPSILLFAHHLIRDNKFKTGIPMLTLGTFAYYGSPPYVFGLAAIFAFERKFKKAVIFFVPGLLYIIFYFWVTLNDPDAGYRINSNLSILNFLKQLILQSLSFTEASIGPSYWLKVFYAISAIGLTSAIIVAIFIAVSFTKVHSLSQKPMLPKSLLFGLICVLLLSFGMFSLTGLYSHSAFNLGNRSTIYGSLLIAFLLAIFLPLNKKSIIFLALIFLLPVFGLSDYWKSWNIHQKKVIEGIYTNQKLSKLPSDSTLLILGNMYSKLGPLSHIEFFSMSTVARTFIRDNVKIKDIVALTSYIHLKNNVLIDLKFGGEFPLTNKIYVYDSEENSVNTISISDVPNLLAERTEEIRHWVQLMRGTWIEDSIVWLSPRLLYLFPNSHN